MKTAQFAVVNHSVDKIDSAALACGNPLFTDDIQMKDMLIAKILTSPHAHAKIKNINTSAAEKLPGVHCVLTYKNVPRRSFTTAGQGYPEPSPYDTFILDNKVRFAGDRVAAVAAESREIAEEAIKLIKVDYEVLPAVLDPRDAMKKGAPVIHDEPEAHMIISAPYDPKKNMASSISADIGDLQKGFDEADFTFDSEYESHYAQHVPMEPHIVISYIDERGRLVIRTSTQVPFHVRRLVAYALGISVKKIRVIKPRIGGGFGAKQEVLIEDICSLLALRTGKPVKLQYTREEEFVSSRTRHPQIIKLKTGIKKDGTITAVHLNVLMNTGAYGSHALTVLCNTGSKVLPLYRCKNIRFDGETVYTNLPVGGAYRGYGATQGYLAMEIQIDEMAEAIGMDPLELRRKNHIKVGEGSPVFEMLGEGKKGVEQKIRSCGLEKCFELGAKEIGWHNRNLANWGLTPICKIRQRFRQGIGMCALMQGSSIPHLDMGACFMKMNEDGSFNLLAGATDLGTGSDTVLAQIAAEVLCASEKDFIVYSSDTDFTPFDVGAYASSTTYLSGMAIKKAAEDIKQKIIKAAAEMLNEKEENLKAENAGGTPRVVSLKTKKSVSYSDIAYYSLYIMNQHQIMGTSSHITAASPPPFAAHFAKVEVDTLTGKVRVLKYVAATDCGTAINPALAEGQVEGAVLNGISFALTEQFIFNDKGKFLNANLTDYKIFSTADLPELKTIMVPTYEETGPFGAKSVSEIGINGPLPAISNAIYNACGIRLRKAPFTPDKVLAALKNLPQK